MVGVYNGISVVDVTNPYDPVELGFFNGPESIWRDLKTWGDYLYCINDQDGDGGAGLQILNLEELINGVSNPTYIENMSLGFETAHNIYIDENGVLYVFGANYGEGGVLIYDVNVTPMDPTFVGAFDNWYVHDGVAFGDTLYLAHVNDGFLSIVDISDRSNPQLLGTKITASSFTHNIWPSDNRDYVAIQEWVAAGNKIEEAE